MTPESRAPNPAPDLATRQRFRLWTALVLLLLPALAFFAWAGSAANPRSVIPWTFTKTRWIVPAPGLASLWIGSALLFWLLSHIAWLLFNPLRRGKNTTLKPWVSAAIILLLAAVTRLLIAATWTPLAFDPGSRPALAWQFLPIFADLLAIAILMLALAGQKKSLWFAALYALHPLPLLEIAGNRHLISLIILPVILLAALSHHVTRPVRLFLSYLAAVTAFIAIPLMLQHNPTGFNSLALELVRTLDIPLALPLALAFAALLLLIVHLGHRRQWPLPKTLAHVLLAFLLFSPVVYPAYILPLLALAPLAWTRAGWYLSLAILIAYLAIPLTPPLATPHLPLWSLLLTWIPPLILEIHELSAETLHLFAPEPKTQPVT